MSGYWSIQYQTILEGGQYPRNRGQYRPEYPGKITNAIEAFKNIVAEGLEADMSNDEVNDLKSSIAEMKKQLDRIAILKQGENQ
ncbi:hypothetical protein Belba_2758 [Belliella baltica DSM 15883]|uniref:Uncharacterized protein n=1 Tax=Belliella baltica (strain DSM 15883 / CIP 108006 / LMG 21964 / BA134) TaxID=866536 RepID=I3Z7T0_BELBD|nr:hypothetical protein [Belliella baltica]AFL85298.1 hypothetical protein Belba_2758 [Belliella baltica DSM 15883]